MNAITLPATDLNVFPICLGNVLHGSNSNQADAFRLLDTYLTAGGNFIDTAKVYNDWLPGERSSSEKTIGAWMRQRRNRGRVLIATKGAHPDLGSMHIPRMSPAEITGDLDASLRHLDIDTIDLYWLHRDDPARPVAEILETLDAQRKAGKIRYYGCSNWHTPRIREAQAYAKAHGLPAFAANQMQWSLAEVDPALLVDKTTVPMNAEMVRFHLETGLTAIPYTSQAGGFFNKLASGRLVIEKSGAFNTPRNLERFTRVQQLSAETGLTITQIALGYLLSQPFITVPIIGPGSTVQLEDSLSALGIHLTSEQLTYLEA